jgi:hypothetical protein
MPWSNPSRRRRSRLLQRSYRLPSSSPGDARGVPFWGRTFELLLSGDVKLAWALLLAWVIILVATVTGHGLAACRSVD